MAFKRKRTVEQQFIQRRRKKWLPIIPILLIGAGAYLLILSLTPYVPILAPIHKIDKSQLARPAGDRVYIPKIGVNVALATGGPEALDKGSWHRFPERGNPTIGGNFIVSAHRFSIGLTAGKTRQQSPFFHIDKLQNGDEVIVDYSGKRYRYIITSHKQVKPNSVAIESPVTTGEESHMTLYTCTLRGESDGREVYFASLKGEIKFP